MMTTIRFQEALKTMPIVAILRGIKADEALGIGEMLLKVGFKIIEVPLNSPKPFDSIKVMASAFGDRAIVGAGTVLNVGDVERLSAVGGQICISPNTNIDVIKRAKALGMISVPAFFTATEAFVAVDAGADALKLFPAELVGPQGLRALKAVLPKEMAIFPVGGINVNNMESYVDVGAAGFGIGTAVFKPGDTAEIVYDKAKTFVDGWTKIRRRLSDISS